MVECFNIQVERMMGTPKFFVLYLAAGIFGFVLGSNFALVGQPSVGASGAIFGTHAALLLCVAFFFFFHRRFPRKRDTDAKGAEIASDLAAHWKIEHQPKRKLFWILIEIVVGFALGWVPGESEETVLRGLIEEF